MAIIRTTFYIDVNMYYFYRYGKKIEIKLSLILIENDNCTNE